MNTKGFTLMEVIIACGVLALFMTGVISLYSSGSKMSNTTMWLQNVNSQLKNASRQINTSIRKSSYPSKIDFPKTIVESRNDNFKVKYKDGELLATAADSAGTNFLQSVECTPAKKGGDTNFNQKATIILHVYSLSKNGNLVYIRYTDDNIDADSIDSSYSTLPSGSAVSTILARDVESVTCKRKGDTQAIEVKIKCAMPKHPATNREEKTVGTSNVEIGTL